MRKKTRKEEGENGLKKRKNIFFQDFTAVSVQREVYWSVTEDLFSEHPG
jgi:hypothetical protein